MPIRIKSISISASDYYRSVGADNPLICSAEAECDDPKQTMTIKLDEYQTLEIMELASPLLFEACKRHMAKLSYAEVENPINVARSGVNLLTGPGAVVDGEFTTEEDNALSTPL